MMTNQKDVKKAGLLYFFAALATKGMAFITMPIFTRLLSTSDYGVINTYNSWVDILTVFLSLALYMAIRTSFVDFPEKTNEFLSTVITFTCLISCLLIGVIVVVYQILPININILFIVLCIIQGFSNALITDYTQFLMMTFQYKVRTLLMIMPNFIGVVLSIFTILFVMRTDLYMGRIVPTALVYAVFGVGILVLVYAKVRPCINKRHLKYSLTISLPLVLHGISLSILSQADRTMITWLADSNQTGIYSLVYNFSMIATVITISLDGVWLPWFMTKLKIKEFSEINKLAKDYVNLITYAMVCLIFVGPEILKLLADQSYWEGITIIPPLVLANYVIFMYTLYVNVEHFYKKTIIITINTVIAAIINIVLNFMFIPKFGYKAAAYTTLISYCVALLLHMNYAKKLEVEIYPIEMFVRPFLHIIIVMGVYYITLNFWFIRWPAGIVYFGTMLIRERKRIGELIPGLASKFSFFR